MDPAIVRLVRMTFQTEKVEDFLQLFSRVAGYIRSFPGCKRLELLEDHTQPNVFTTYSIWASDRDLDEYKLSPLFEETWSVTRAMFSESPTAVSYRVVRTAEEIDQLAGTLGSE
jgi:heme-degrading monooxygenase HmoA